MTDHFYWTYTQSVGRFPRSNVILRHHVLKEIKNTKQQRQLRDTTWKKIEVIMQYFFFSFSVNEKSRPEVNNLNLRLVAKDTQDPWHKRHQEIKNAYSNDSTQTRWPTNRGKKKQIPKQSNLLRADSKDKFKLPSINTVQPMTRSKHSTEKEIHDSGKGRPSRNGMQIVARLPKLQDIF